MRNASLSAVLSALAIVGLSACGGHATGAGDWEPTWQDDCPVWSPDGSRLAFGRDSGGVYVYDLRMRNLQRMLRDDVEVLSWSADGWGLVVVDPRRSDARRAAKLLRVDIRTRRRVLLLDLARTKLSRPRDLYDRFVPAPGARRMAIDRIGDAWVVEIPNGRARLLTKTDDIEVDWSPDGRWVAYSDLDHIYLARADMRLRRRLVGGEFRGSAASSPRFSPDSRLVAYQDTGSGHTSDVYVADIKTGARRQVTYESRSEEGPAAWWPDGSKILVQTGSGGGLLATDLRGRITSRLPEWEGAWPGTGTACPAISPGGQEIAFLRTWPAGIGGELTAVYLTPADLKTAKSPEAP